MKHLFLVIILLFSYADLFGQLGDKKNKFTKADTLRGTIGPDRDWFDVTYYDLHLDIDIPNHAISGYNDIAFKVLRPHNVMQIDLFENMVIDSIVFNDEVLEYKRDFNAVMIDIPKKQLKKGTEQSVRFHYSGKPVVARMPPWDGGMVYKKDSNGKDWIGVAVQGLGASAWYPNKDHQSDEPDSVQISMAVPNDLMFVSNGNLRKTEKEGENTRYTWFVSYPINNYNVTLNIGDFVHIEDEHKGKKSTLKLDYYVLRENVDKAKVHFDHDVFRMMDCFEEYMGEYPFKRDGFAMVETPYLGMEHQGAIAYGNGYKFGYDGNTRYTSGHEFDYIVVHEAGHEWWGNNITSYDIADLWIHEGFCTYSEAIFVECEAGTEAALKYINDKKPFIKNADAIIGPYGVNKEGSGDMYTKGSLFINTLRHIIDNDELWWDIMRGLNKDFAYSIVTTADIIEYFNKKSGKKLDKVFDQYLRHANLPVLEYKPKKKGKHTLLTYRWKTDVDGFEMPIDYQDAKGNWQRLMPSGEWQTMKIKKVKPDALQFAEDNFYVVLKNQRYAK